MFSAAFGVVLVVCVWFLARRLTQDRSSRALPRAARRARRALVERLRDVRRSRDDGRSRRRRDRGDGARALVSAACATRHPARGGRRLRDDPRQAVGPARARRPRRGCVGSRGPCVRCRISAGSQPVPRSRSPTTRGRRRGSTSRSLRSCGQGTTTSGSRAAMRRGWMRSQAETGSARALACSSSSASRTGSGAPPEPGRVWRSRSRTVAALAWSIAGPLIADGSLGYPFDGQRPRDRRLARGRGGVGRRLLRGRGGPGVATHVRRAPRLARARRRALGLAATRRDAAARSRVARVGAARGGRAHLRVARAPPRASRRGPPARRCASRSSRSPTSSRSTASGARAGATCSTSARPVGAIAAEMENFAYGPFSYHLNLARENVSEQRSDRLERRAPDVLLPRTGRGALRAHVRRARRLSLLLVPLRG